jgi:peptidoglycan/LPS O-acetylase OafA/YrhL
VKRIPTLDGLRAISVLRVLVGHGDQSHLRAICHHFLVPGPGHGTFPAVADVLAIECLLAIFQRY